MVKSDGTSIVAPLSKLDIATAQLDTAIALYLYGGLHPELNVGAARSMGSECLWSFTGEAVAPTPAPLRRDQSPLRLARAGSAPSLSRQPMFFFGAGRS
jgi:hypothetical protein